MSPTVVATDLDGTVLFSERAAGLGPGAGPLRPIDVDGQRTYAYMTVTAVGAWRALASSRVLVPATTRSVPQFQRLRLPGPPPALAVVCNGARLLVHGDSDPAWERSVRHAVAATAVPFREVWRQAAAWCGQRGFASLRTVEDFFVYLTVADRQPWLAGFAHEADAWCRDRGWRASLQGRKLYLLPASLDKAPAVAEVAARLGAGRVVAGGDSLLDEGMLRAADAGILPAHGELFVTGFAAPHCVTTASRGAAAGDEILNWYVEQLADG